MNNIVDFRTGPSRPRCAIMDSKDGAEILFFTGVRYSRAREDQLANLRPELALLADPTKAGQQPVSEAALELAAY